MGRIARTQSAEQSVAFMRGGACAGRHVSLVNIFTEIWLQKETVQKFILN